MPGGLIIGGAFFFLAFIAALTSSISLLLSSVTIGLDQYNLSRMKATLIPGAIVWAVGIMAITVAGLEGWLDFLSGSVMITLGGFLIATFVGWAVPRDVMRGELKNTSDGMFGFWHFFCKWLAPAAVAVTLLLGVDSKFNFGLNALLGG